jgi:electron transfer flavoprotein alpha subunit
LIPSPNNPSSDLGSLLSASSSLPSPVDILQVCSSETAESVESQVQSIVDASTINSVFLHSIDGMTDNSYFQCLEDIKQFVSNNKQYTHIVMGNGVLPKELLPRIAVANNSQCISDVISILDNHRFQRPVYAGNAISTVKAILKNESGECINFKI